MPILRSSSYLEERKAFCMKRGCGQGELDEDDLRRLNFHSEKIPWTTIGLILDKFDWEAIFEGRNVEECTHIFLEIIKTICLEIIPRKNKINRSKIPRERKTLLNRIKMLKRNKHRANSMKKKRKIEESIFETEKAPVVGIGFFEFQPFLCAK